LTDEIDWLQNQIDEQDTVLEDEVKEFKNK
jgi:hypothetical protein